MPSPAGTTDEYDDATWRNYFPLALIVEEDDEDGINFVHTADSFSYNENVALTIEFQDFRDPDESNTDAHRKFKDAVHMIWKDILTQSGQAERFAVSETSHSPAFIPNPNDEDSDQRMYLTIRVAYLNE